jgi:peptidyl-prolyl cis-trans isomerase SurA
MAAALLGAALAVSAAAAQTDDGPQLLDRIVAIVDEEAILQSDLDREVELFRMEQEYNGRPMPADPVQVRREMLERLIESKLIIAAAKQAEMTVDQEAIDQSVEQKIQQFVEHFGSMEALRRELLRSGMTLEDYRARMASQLRDQQYLRLVVGRFIRPDIEVMENEVRDYYLEHLDEMPVEPDSVTIANILIPIQPSPDTRRQVQQTVEEIRAALDGGLDFAAAAQRWSRGPNAGRGGAIGTLARGDLFDRNLDRAVFALPEGQVSEPLVSPRGVHLMRVDAVLEDGRRAVSQIFLPIELTEADRAAARVAIDAARERIVGGEPFALVANEVSADQVSAANGGVLGTFRLEDLTPQFQTALEGAEEGQVTEPVLTNAGWYIFKVLERKSGHMFTYEELRDQLRQQVETLKIEEALAAYVAELRTRFFIDEKS